MKRISAIAVITLLCSCHPVRVPSSPIPPTSEAGPPTTIAENYKAAKPPVDSPPGPVNAGSLPEPSQAPVDLKEVVRGLNGQLQDAFFDYDRSDLRPDALASLQQDARLLAHILSDFPQLKVIIEGHCDERGSAEYNLALGDSRATRAAASLRGWVPAPNVETVSYGKEAPQCTEPTESCWQRNRRVHLIVRQ